MLRHYDQLYRGHQTQYEQPPLRWQLYSYESVHLSPFNSGRRRKKTFAVSTSSLQHLFQDRVMNCMFYLVYIIVNITFNFCLSIVESPFKDVFGKVYRMNSSYSLPSLETTP